MMKQAPAWFKDIVIEGIQVLVAAHLKFGPANELLPATVETWAICLWGQRHWQAKDAERLKSAFYFIAGTQQDFPTIKQVLDNLPMPDEPVKVEHKISEQQRKKNLKRLQAMIKDLKVKK